MKVKLGIIVFFVIGLILFSCKGEPGAAGDKGATGPAGGTGAIVMSFQDGVFPSDNYAGTSDAAIINSVPEYNNGACTSFDAANSSCTWNSSRALLKFDVSSLVPSNVTVKKAYLELHTIDGAGPIGFVVHELTRAFDEGTSCNAKGTCSWISATASTMWTTPGGDYDATQMSSVVNVADLSINQAIIFELNASVVQKWINDPSKNFGMIIKAYPETGSGTCLGAEFATSEYATKSIRPKLTIYYNLP